MKICFADCILDIDARRLVRGGEEAHLPPKAFDLLKLLVENRPRVLSKTELIERVWPGVFVSDASLAKVVSRIRRAIGQDDDARIVRTVHGCGYAFAAELFASAARQSVITLRGRLPRLLAVLRRARVPLDGWRAHHRTRIECAYLARLAEGVAAPCEGCGQWRKRCPDHLDSKNGSFVRGVPVTGPTPLAPGDDVRIGPFALIFRVADGTGSTESEVR